jgi:ketosteroid isomerase-like protein
MASANVELVRSLFNAWERGNWSSAEWAHPDIEFVIDSDWGPLAGAWRGPAGMVEGFRPFISSWEEYRLEASEYLEVDDERVLVSVELRGRGKTSGVEIEKLPTEAANLFHLRDGKVTRLVLYLDREHALTELGLTS